MGRGRSGEILCCRGGDRGVGGRWKRFAIRRRSGAGGRNQGQEGYQWDSGSHGPSQPGSGAQPSPIVVIPTLSRRRQGSMFGVSPALEDGSTETIEADEVLVATGRHPNTEYQQAHHLDHRPYRHAVARRARIPHIERGVAAPRPPGSIVAPLPYPRPCDSNGPPPRIASVSWGAPCVN